MPEATGGEGEKPELQRVVEQVNPPRMLESTLSETAQRRVLDLRAARTTARARYGADQERYKGNRAMLDAVDAAYQIAYGPLLLEEGTLPQTTDERRKELLARTQHRLAEAVLHAGSEAASDTYVRNIYDTVARLNEISRSEAGAREDLHIFWSGLKGEIAVLRALHPQYHLYLPDTASASPEVKQWDIQSNVDFIAIARDRSHAIFVNAQGEYGRHEGGRLVERGNVTVETQPVSANSFTQPTLRRFITEQKLDELPLSHATITVPVSDMFNGGIVPVRGLGATLSPKDYRERIQRFGRLTPALASTILTGLK